MRTEGEVEVEVSVLGSVGIRRNGTEVELGMRLRRLLAGLVVSNGSVVSTDRLVDVVWAGDPPDGAEKTLTSYVTRLRRALDPKGPRIVFREPGYVIDLSTAELDSAMFDDDLERGLQHLRAADTVTASGVLEGAIARWRGRAYAGFAEEDWARPESVRLEERLVEAREALIEARLAGGLDEDAAAEAQALAETEPLRERPRSLLMRAMYASGRQAEALRAFSSYRRYLAEETGLDPSEEMVELERRIARGDPSLTGGVRPLRGYELGERIGEGAFAVVHRAVQPGIERDVAVKIIRAELADRPDFIRRFEFEARTVARIEHPNVVPLFDYWREPGAAYLVMRLLQGGSVEDALRAGGPYSRERTVRMLDDVGGALETAHRAGVVHRDVRPANLLLDAEGTTYLADFGIALPTAAIDNVPIASPAYAAPEVLRGEPVGIAADVLSLAITTFETLTGRLPFADSVDRGDLIRRQLTEPLPPARATRTDLPQEVDDVLARATAKAPADRYATVAAFVDEMRLVLDPTAPASRPMRIGWRGPVHNPYLGLHAFDEEDADRFFGREQLVAELLDALERRAMVAVVGPSGSGKSSVVRAGVLPAVRRGALPGSEDWFVATMVPGTSPVDALETALLRVAVNPPATLREQLAEPGGLLRAIRRVLPDERSRLLLVVDQFEELFIQVGDPGERDRFLVELGAAVTEPDSPLSVIATLRADHYDAPLRHLSVAELVTAGTVTVRPMTNEELERAISLPATAVGVEIESALVTDLVAGLTARPAALPLLQFSLTELFDRRVSNTMLLSTHRELGGLTGALAARADRILDEGGPDDEREMRRIFGRLVTPGDGTDDTRRRAVRSEFGDGERTAWLIDAFVTARLITTDRDPSSREPTIEVAHEALLREWPRAVAWLREDRELRRTVGTIGAATDAWDRGGRQPSDLYRGGRLESALEVAEANPDWLRPTDHEFLDASDAQAEADRDVEQRRVRRLRRLAAGIAAALVVALVAGGIAFTQQRRADQEARAAEEAASEAERQREVAETRAEEATEARDEAENQAVIAEAATADAELNELVALSAAAAIDRPNQGLLLALEAHRRAPGPETVSALLDVVASGRLGWQVAGIQRLPDEGCGGVGTSRLVSPDGLLEYGVVGTELYRHDLVSGEVTTHGTAPTRCTGWYEDAESGLRSALTTDLTRNWTGSRDSGWTEVELLGGAGPPAFPRGGPLNPLVVDGRYVYGLERGGFSAEVAVVDAVSLDRVGPAIPDMDFNALDPFPVVAAHPGRGMFAVGADSPDGADDLNGLVVVLDAASGAETLRLSRPDRVTAVAFDADGTTLLTGGENGTIAVFDAASGELLLDATLTESSELVRLGVRDDGTIVAVGRRSIELFEPLGGRPRALIEIPAADDARVRTDGDVVVFPAGDTDSLLIIDPNRGPLVERGWEIDTEALVGFGAGQAGVVDPSGTATVVELDSGIRHDADLTMPDGEPFDAVAMIPEADGHLAWNDGRVVARWRGGSVVEELELWSEQNIVSLTPDDGLARVETGGGFAGAGAAVVFEFASTKAVYGFDPTPGNLAMISRLDSPPFITRAAVPAPNGGLNLVLTGGTVRTYNRSTERIGEIESGIEDPAVIVADPATGAIAIGGETGAVIVDPSTQAVQSLTDVGAVVSLGFARDGSLLVVVESDGSVRLWDVERAALVGTLRSGGSTAPSSPTWYDEMTDTVWVATSGRILQFSLDPARWIERICDLLPRELTADEWERLVPGETEQRPACD